MSALIRILLAANLICASVTVPATVANFSMGAGAGGSSFFQGTFPSDVDSDLKAAQIILNQVCDGAKWDEAAQKDQSKKTPDFSDIKAIASQANNLDWDLLCIPKVGPKNEPRGISIVGSAANEMRMLFTGQTDRRVLYALVYLYQKRFSAQGYNMVCEAEDKYAPVMTVAIHTDAGKEDFSLGNAGNYTVSREDDLNSTDPNVSPHAHGQAFDVVTFGCVFIRDKDGNLQAIVPNYLASAQTLAPKQTNNSSQDVFGALAQGMSASGGISSDSALMANLMSNSGSSVFETGTDLMKEQMGPLAILGGMPGGILPSGKDSALFSTLSKQFGSSGKGFDLATVALGASLEKKLGLPQGSLLNGKIDPEQIGFAKIKELFGVDLTGKQVDSKSLNSAALGMLTKNLNGFETNLPDEALSLMKQGKYDEAAKIIGQGLAGKVFTKNLKGEDASLADALMKGGYSALSAQILNLENSRSSDNTYQLASLLSLGNLGKSDVSALNDFVNGLKEQDSVLRQSALEGAIRNFSGNNNIHDWMVKIQGVSQNAGQIENLISLVNGYKNSSDPTQYIKQVTGTYRGQILMTAYNELGSEERTIFGRALGGNVTPEALEGALGSGELDEIGQKALLAIAAQRSGLPQDATVYLAGGLNDNDLSSSALSYINQKYSLDLSSDDFKLSGSVDLDNMPGALKKIALWQVGRTIGKSSAQIQSLISGGDNTRLDLAKDYAAKLGVPSWTADLAANAFTGNDPHAFSKLGVSALGKQFADLIPGSAGEKGALENFFVAYFNGSVEQGKTLAEAQGTQILTAKGLSFEDAQKIVSGNFQDADKAVLAAGISSKLSYMNYDEAKQLVSGNLDKTTMYSISDRMLTDGLEVDGFRYQFPANASQILAEGSIKDYSNKGTSTSAITNRDQLTKDFGESYGAYEISKMAQSNLNVNVPADALKNAIQSGDWVKLGTQTAASTAADKLSSSLGLPADKVMNLYNLYNQNKDLGGKDFLTVGKNIFQDQTGISSEAFKNIDETMKGFGDKLIAPYQNTNYSALAGNMGASIIVNTLLGPQLAKIDPTGGLLTGFALNWAATELAVIGGPYLLAAAFIINPQATMQSIMGMFNQAVALFTNPMGYFMSMFSMFGFGPKSKAQSEIRNKTFKDPELSNKDLGDETVNKPATAENKGASATTTAARQASSDYANKTPSASLASSTPVGAVNRPANSSTQAAVQTQLAASDYLPAKEPSQKFLKQVDLRTLDQVFEDLVIFSLVDSSNRDLVQNHWQGFMAGIKPPSSPMSLKQLVVPRVMAASASEVNPKFPDLMYDPNAEYDQNVVGISPILTRLKAVYGTDFNPLTIYGRKSGLGFDQNTTDRIHVGF